MRYKVVNKFPEYDAHYGFCASVVLRLLGETFVMRIWAVDSNEQGYATTFVAEPLPQGVKLNFSARSGTLSRLSTLLPTWWPFAVAPTLQSLSSIRATSIWKVLQLEGTLIG